MLLPRGPRCRRSKSHSLHCAVLCCAVLCCAVLCCAVLCCAVLCCAVLCCAPGTYEDRAVPTRIKALVGKDIERVAGGQHHTIFLRRDGVVYGCGSCKLGQVRHGSSGNTQQQ